jgi:hypothetical protein
VADGDLRALQEAILATSGARAFNVTEIAEFFKAWLEMRDTLGQELADIAISVLGLPGVRRRADDTV